MRGKNKCKILKEIRQKIAEENDIPYVTRECTYQGECSGTCPKCEAELRYLEQQLEKRQRLGKRVTVAALAASLMTGLTACPEDLPLPKTSELSGDVPHIETTTACENTPSETPGIIESETGQTELVELEGLLPSESEETEETAELIGEITSEPETDSGTEIAGAPPAPEDYYVLEGDVAYLPDETVEYFTQESDG